MKIDLSRFRETFFHEAADHVNSMEQALLELSSAPGDPELLNSVFRAAHSIKGGSGTFALDEITRFTHTLESLLDRMRQGKVETCPERIRLLLSTCDILRGLLDAARSNSAPPPETEQLLVKVTAAQREGEFVLDSAHRLREQDADADSRLRTWSIHFAPSPSIFQEGMDPLLVLRELRELGTVEEITADLSRLPLLADLSPDTCHLAWNIRLATDKGQADIRDVFAFVEDGARLTVEPMAEPPGRNTSGSPAVQPSTRASQQSHDSGSIRVSTQKVDQLVNLIGELVIAESMASEVAEHFRLERVSELKAALSEVARNTRELQERIMSIRMLPVASTFARLHRVVHDVAAARGKSIQIEVRGQETELDKSVLEGMVDPLTHIVRNAADHGIGTVEERSAVGKPAQGTIGLYARHEAGNFVLEVSDDGRGLNLARIRAKAIERGLLNESDQPTPEQLQEMIFHPGFSTAHEISEVSGRGVGMDVVRRNVEALGGAVSLRSEEGKGTTVIIRLPLTLAILDGQLVRVGEQIYVVPLVSIIESIQPSREQVCTVAGAGEVVTVRQEALLLLRLHHLFGVATEVVDPCSGLVVVAEHAGRRFALLVDELLNQQQVVIKNLQTNFRKVEGAMGATILGDGRVSLILDIGGVVELANRADKYPAACELQASPIVQESLQNRLIGSVQPNL